MEFDGICAQMSEKRLILGGARSGKSALAEQKVLQLGAHPAYLATGQSFDQEMDQRIAQHKNERDTKFTTLECPIDLEKTIELAAQNHDAILVDCLTLWVSNLMMAETADIDARGLVLCDLILQISVPIVMVSNEVGLGIVPENKMARVFRDHAGKLHQNLARVCDHVTFVAAGLPLAMKGEI